MSPSKMKWVTLCLLVDNVKAVTLKNNITFFSKSFMNLSAWLSDKQL